MISQNYSLKNDLGDIDITLYGKIINEEQISQLRDKMANYKLDNAELNIHQGYAEDKTEQVMLEFEKMGQALKGDILENLYIKSEEIIKSKEARIALLENELVKVQKRNYPIKNISDVLIIQYENLVNLSIGDMPNQSSDTVTLAIAQFKPKLKSSEQVKIEKWLEVCVKADSLVLVIK